MLVRIGDRVRLLRGTEEGRVVNIQGDKIVEVEIEDGFTIPALINEVVIIDKKEAEIFGNNISDQDPIEEIKQKNHIPDGVYLGIIENEENSLGIYFINQTDDTVLYSISQNDRKVINGKSFGICEKFRSKEIGDFTSSIFNESKRLSCQILFHENQTRLIKQPLVILKLHKSVELFRNRNLCLESTVNKHVFCFQVSLQVSNFEQEPKDQFLGQLAFDFPYFH